MPLDDNLLDAIAGTIAETEREFRAALKEMDERIENRELALGAELDTYEGKTGEDMDRLSAEIAATEQRLITDVVELRKEHQDDVDAAAAGHHELCTRLDDLTNRLATLKDGEPGEKGDKGDPGDSGERGEKGDKGDPGEPAPDPTEDMVAAALDKLREDRLEIDEKLFAAAKRFDRLSAELEERLATLKDGEPGPAGPEGASGRDGVDGRTGDARGLYAAAETYRKMDRVSLNGSEWIARKDDPGPLPGDGWMLGAQGKTGKPGTSVQRIATKDYALVLEMSDGKTMTIDMRGMFERYNEERE